MAVILLFIALGAVVLFFAPRFLLNEWLADKTVDAATVRPAVGNAAQVVLFSLGGVIALVGVGLSLSRHGLELENSQHDRSKEDRRVSELGQQRRIDAERELRARFTQAVALVSDPNKPTTRQAGVYALGALADDWMNHERQDERQVCIDVICSYLRSAWDPAAAGADDEMRIRATAFDLIGAHLRPDTDRQNWDGAEFNLRGARFHFDINWAGIELGRSHLILRQAVMSGGTLDLRGALFTGGRLDFGLAQFNGGSVRANGAAFDGTFVDFLGATFAGDVLDLRSAFGGGTIDFRGARFMKGWVDFRAATFSGSKVRFQAADFVGGAVRFNNADLKGGSVNFGGANFSTGVVPFSNARFAGSDVSFENARFAGGLVNFDSAKIIAGRVSFQFAHFTGTDISFMSGRGEGAGSLDFDPPAEWTKPPLVDWDESSVPIYVRPQIWPPVARAPGPIAQDIMARDAQDDDPVVR